MNALKEAMMKRHYDLKYANIAGTEKPGKWEMKQSQKELKSLGDLEKWDKKMTEFVMRRYKMPETHFNTQDKEANPIYQDGGDVTGNMFNDADTPTERVGGTKGFLQRLLPGGKSGYQELDWRTRHDPIQRYKVFESQNPKIKR